MTVATTGKPLGERVRLAAPPRLVLSLLLCAGAVLLQSLAFVRADPWLGGDLVGAGLLLVFVSDVIVEPEGDGPTTSRFRSSWIPSLVALAAGMALLIFRPAPMPPLLVQALAVLGAGLAVFEGLLKAGQTRS